MSGRPTIRARTLDLGLVDVHLERPAHLPRLMRYELSVFGTRYVVEELDTKAYRGSINRNSTMRRADLSLMTHIAPSVDLYGLAGGHTPGRLRREGSAVIGGRLR